MSQSLIIRKTTGNSLTVVRNGATASGSYTLLPATVGTLGGIIVGDNLTITANGVLSGVNSYTLPAATNSTLGGVVVPEGGNLTVDSSGNLTVTDGAFMPYPNYNGTNLAAIPFVGTGLADTSNTACSVAIGLIPNYSNYKIYGAFTNYNNTLQINGLTDIYSGGQLSPALAAGNAANGTGGIYAVPGDCRLINIGNPQTSSSVVSKGYVDSTVASLPYLNNSTTNSTLTYSEGVISGFHYSTLTRKATGANSTNSERTEWLSNTGKFGNIQWTLKPNTGLYNWTWGGLSLDANTTDATRPEMSLSTNYSLDFSAGNAYGRGIGISTRDVYLKETYFSGPSLPAKEWSDNSFLIRSYADSRYLPTANFTYANLTGTPTLATVATSGSYTDLTGTPDLTGYLTTASASSTYATIASLSDYLTTASASSTYQPIGSYATTGANTFSGTQSLAGNIVDKPRLQAARDTKTAPAISAGTLTLDLNTSNFFAVSLNAAITTLSVTNVPTGVVASFVLEFTADGTARAVAWPASFKFPSGTAPTLTTTSGKKDVFVVYTADDGTTFDIVIAGQNL